MSIAGTYRLCDGALQGANDASDERVDPDLQGERWRLACGVLPLGSFELNPDRSLTSSAELDDLCGLGAGETMHSIGDLLERVAVEQRAGLLATLTAPVGAGSTLEIGFGLVRVDGELHDVQLRGKWIKRNRRNVLVAIVVEGHKDEAGRLADLAERYRTLAEVSPDIIVVHQDGVVVYANPATLTHLGASDPSDVVGKPILGFFSEESRRAFMNRVSMMAETHSVAAFSEEQVTALDGSVVDIEATSILTTWEGRPAYQAVARVITERKQAERQLREQAALIDAVSDAIVMCRGDRVDRLRIESWSKGAERLYGWSEAEARGRLLGDVIGLESSRLARWWRRLVLNGVGAHETNHVRRDGSSIPVHVSATLLRGDEGEPAGVITVSTDISLRAAAETAKRQLEERYSAVVEALDEGIIVINTDGTVQAANAAAERIFGVTAEMLIGTVLAAGNWSAIHEDGSPLEPHEWPAEVTLRSGVAQTNFLVGLVRGGDTTWVSINSRPLSASSGASSPVVCSVSDISIAKVAQDRLAYEATHDTLTNLPNRAGIADHLAELAYDGVSDLAVLFVDLDRFKVINDSLGHTAGDRLLRAVATRISETMRSRQDIVGRLAGDEFVVLCPDLGTKSHAEVVASRLLDAIREPVTITDGAGVDHTVTITASIGVAHLAEDESPEDVLIDADVAMYAAKEDGRGCVHVFDESLRQKARERLEIREDLRAAIEKDELHLAYQPIVDPSGAIKGYEALARWDHPVRGPVPTSDFIPIAEESGLVVPLGAWVLAEAASTASAWQRAGNDSYLSVNLSTKQVADPDLVPMVASILATTGLAPGSLWLEITESSVMRDAEAATVILTRLKALGVKLAIDDFGTGYSSLAYLEKFPVDALKIDRSFVSVLDPDSTHPTLIAGIVSLAHSLDLVVVAEGVETEAQAATLVDLEVDAMQGYLHGYPGKPPLGLVEGCPESGEAVRTT